MFEREDTRIIKGIAIVLMLMHHLFAFPDRYPSGFSFASTFTIYDMDFIVFLGQFGKICVALYMFLGGYGLFCQYNIGQKLHENIFRLYKNYWKIFFIFVPMGFLFFSNQPSDYCTESAICSVFSKFDLNEFISNFIGWKATYNREWWFFKNYLCTIFLGYIFIQIIQSHKSFWIDLFWVIIIFVMTQEIFPAISSLPMFNTLSNNIFYTNFFTLNQTSCSFFMGIVFAKYDILSQLHKKLSSYKKVYQIVICICSFILAPCIRQLFGSQIDLFLVPAFIFFCMIFCKNIPFISKVFRMLGEHNSNIWLIHSFYCYYYYQITKIVYSSKYAFIDLIILISVSLISSVCVDYFYIRIKSVTKNTENL